MYFAINLSVILVSDEKLRYYGSVSGGGGGGVSSMWYSVGSSCGINYGCVLSLHNRNGVGDSGRRLRRRCHCLRRRDCDNVGGGGCGGGRTRNNGSC